jgi:UDP-N-acetylglucosamine enolpyruvyl transferase
VAESQHVDRGYPFFVEMLDALGADVRRVDVPDLDA